MANQRTRRDFLKVTAVGIAGSAAAEMAPSLRAESGAAGPVDVWMTNETLRCAKVEPAQWKKSAAPAGTPTIVLSPNKKFQTIAGFGGAFTDAACFTMNRLEAGARAIVPRNVSSVGPRLKRLQDLHGRKRLFH